MTTENEALRSSHEWSFKILYDGECPFCLREVRWLQRRNRFGHLAFEDVTSSSFDPSTVGVSREELLEVIHGLFPDGRVVKRMEVFRQAYRAVGLGWLIAPTDWPGLRWVFDGLYSLFARYRVRLGRWFGRSCASAGCRAEERQGDSL
jgi:predicted DCC family thiol-disulfide oxidoreductase YuxK